MTKYEQLIEHIINDNEQAARELFHNIVVEKSREIYESLMDEDQVEENIDQYDQGGSLEQDIRADETQGLGEEEDDMGDEMGGDDMGDEMGGDDMGDEMGDMGGDDMGDMGDMGGDDNLADKFQSIEDALEELKAEFAELGGDIGGEEEMGGDMGGDDMGNDMGGEEEMGGEEDGMMEAMSGSGSGSGKMESANPFAKSGSGKSGSGKSDSGKSGSGKSGSGKSGSGKAMSEAELMREYVEKISAPSNTEGAPVGTGTGGDKANVNTANPVAGKNDMGGTAANIVKGGTEQAPDGTTPKGKAGGFLKAAQEIDVAKRNVNKVGGNKGAQDFYNTKAKGKTGEGQTTDGSVSVNKQSLEGGKK